MAPHRPVSPARLAGRLTLVFVGTAAVATVAAWLGDDGSARSWPDAVVIGLIGGVGCAFLAWVTTGAPEGWRSAQRAVTRGALPSGAEPERMHPALLHVKRMNRRLMAFVAVLMVGCTGLWLVAVDPADLVDPDLWWIGPALFAVLAIGALALGRWLDGRADRLLGELGSR